MVRAEARTSAIDLRRQCRDAGFDPGWRCATKDGGGGDRHWLSADDMKDVLGRIEGSKEGRRMWAGLPCLAPKVVHMFWGVSSDLSTPSTLPGYAKLGIASAVLCGYEVQLWACCCLEGVPSAVM